MNAYSQKYCLVSFFDDVKIGQQFHMSEWPLHITLVDVFAIDDIDTAKATINQALQSVKAFDVEALNGTMLGKTPVMLVEKSRNILQLHSMLMDILDNLGAAYNSPAFTREGFLPHISTKNESQLDQGDTVSVSSVCLVDMYPEAKWQQRKVLAVWNFGLPDNT